MEHRISPGFPCLPLFSVTGGHFQHSLTQKMSRTRCGYKAHLHTHTRTLVRRRVTVEQYLDVIQRFECRHELLCFNRSHTTSNTYENMSDHGQNYSNYNPLFMQKEWEKNPQQYTLSNECNCIPADGGACVFRRSVLQSRGVHAALAAFRCAVCMPLSTACMPPSTACMPTSTACMPTSTTRACQPPLRATLHCEHATIHCMHATLHCVHATLHCVHATLHCVHTKTPTPPIYTPAGPIPNQHHPQP